jgi:hypothetical protein
MNKQQILENLKQLNQAVTNTIECFERGDYVAAFSTFVFKQNDVMDSINHSGSMAMACMKVREEIFHAITHPTQES